MNVALPAQRLNVISLCTGGGGLDLGIGLALPSAHPVVLVEREAFAVAHLVAAIEQGLLAEAAIWSDVRTFDGRPFRGLVDGLIGGIPCQPHSLAGKRKGQDDERDLWSAARKIIVRARPWFVVIENVEGMLSSGGAARVVGDLRKLGFSVEIGLFSATEAGASHQRNRVFIVAVADTGFAERGTWRAGRSGALGGWAYDQSAGSSVELADTIGAGLERFGWHGHDGDEPGRLNAGEERPVGARGVSVDDAIRGRRPAGRLDHGSDDGDVAGATGEYPVVNASIIGRGEGLSEPSVRSGRDTAAGADQPVVHAAGSIRWPDRRSEREGAREGCGQTFGGPIREGHRQANDDGPAAPSGHHADIGLFPPGPSDIDRWRRVLEDSPHLEPAVRRMADGVAARLDLTGPHAARIERLRLLGNGVVCMEAAYAFRTLVSRLAASGSACAAQLVRLMEGIDA